MQLGNSLFRARKKSGLSQEEVAAKLGVTRQTISKWELNETLPDIHQAKSLSLLYSLTLDELIAYDPELETIQHIIDTTSEETQKKVDWTKAWGKKYPVLLSYPETVQTEPYARQISAALDDLQMRYGYNDLDAMLVYKDILAQTWKTRGKQKE